MDILAYGWNFFNPEMLLVVKFVVGGLGALTLLADIAEKYFTKLISSRRFRRYVLACLGLFSVVLWSGDIILNFRPYIHSWDLYHYYMGSKYFKELGYKKLYGSVAVAESENGYRDEVENRAIRDLKTNIIVDTSAVLANPHMYKQGFSEERWQSFKNDVAYFRKLVSKYNAERWAKAQTDHGFNGSPTWSLLASFLANMSDASDRQVFYLTLIDSLFLLTMWGLVFWAFGWQAMCVGLIFWGTNQAAMFSWTNASFLRQDWLMLSIAAICFMKRQKMALAGWALTYAALLRVFPGIMIVGLILKIFSEMWKHKRIVLSSARKDFLFGCVLALIILVPLTTVFSGRGGKVWPEFIDNCIQHTATPLINYMGLKTVLSFGVLAKDYQVTSHPHDLGDKNWLADNQRFISWREAREQTFKNRKYWFVIIIGCFVALLWRAVINVSDWRATVLSLGMITISIELTCYYYSFLSGYAFLSAKQKEIGAGLLAVSAITNLIVLFLKDFDVRYAAMSMLVVLFVVYATWLIGVRGVIEKKPSVRIVDEI